MYRPSFKILCDTDCEFCQSKIIIVIVIIIIIGIEHIPISLVVRHPLVIHLAPMMMESPIHTRMLLNTLISKIYSVDFIG